MHMGIGSRITSLVAGLFDVEPHERLKLLFLTVIFFFVIGGYTIAKELKDSLFVSIVGKEYIPLAKTIEMIVLLPAIFLYAVLVDKLRRYQLLTFYCALFGVVGLIFAYLIGHPTIGLPNTHTGPSRLFGWLFYFFVEGYSPFIVSVFWAFANSITSPQAAKQNYGLMVCGSKIGGMLSAGTAWMIFSWGVKGPDARTVDILNHQIVYLMSLVMLLIVPFAIWMLMKYVPARYMHGYEAAYQAEKQKVEEGAAQTGVFAGLSMLIKYPYVFGIFGMVYFYEVISTVLSYLRLGVAESHANSLSAISAYLFSIAFQTHAIGFLIALFGTRELLRKLGTRICLMLIPLFCGILLLYLVLDASPYIFGMAYAVLKSINYAFSWPVRESLYIPTIKEIKFKSKSWIDAFGSKIARTTGSSFNFISTRLGYEWWVSIHAFFFAGIIGLWFFTAFLLGRRFDTAIANDEVIGFDNSKEPLKI
jgi:ATP:ADP antiporter, AAA family